MNADNAPVTPPKAESDPWFTLPTYDLYGSLAGKTHADDWKHIVARVAQYHHRQVYSTSLTLDQTGRRRRPRLLFTTVSSQNPLSWDQ